MVKPRDAPEVERAVVNGHELFQTEGSLVDDDVWECQVCGQRRTDTKKYTGFDCEDGHDTGVGTEGGDDA